MCEINDIIGGAPFTSRLCDFKHELTYLRAVEIAHKRRKLLPVSAQNRTDLWIEVSQLDRHRTVPGEPGLKKFMCPVAKWIFRFDLLRSPQRVNAAKSQQRIPTPTCPLLKAAGRDAGVKLH